MKKRHSFSASSDPAVALSSDATPKIVRLMSSKGLRPIRSPIGPADRAPTMMPMLDHRNACVNAGGGKPHALINDGTAQAIELTSYPSQICTSRHSTTTRICRLPMRWFSSACSTAETAVSAIVFSRRAASDRRLLADLAAPQLAFPGPLRKPRASLTRRPR